LRQHGLGIGVLEREGSIGNLLSHATCFGLKTFKAKRIINTVQQRPHYFKQHGVGDGDLERLKGIIPTP